MTVRGRGAADLLETIVAATRRTIEVRETREPFAGLARRAEMVPALRRLRDAVQRDGINVIAECKRRSPSRGVLRADYDPVALAKGYAAAGAAAISVLTEPSFFDGSLVDLAAVRAAVDVPVLRKDFVVSEYQIVEARAAGADAVLLIVGALTPGELATLLARADAWGLDALVEVHALEELAVAVDAGASIIGVNNRNLRTLAVDVRASDAIIGRMPPDIVSISESGLRAAADLMRLRALGYHGFLIGERFMASADPGLALRGLLEECRDSVRRADLSGPPK